MLDCDGFIRYFNNFLNRSYNDDKIKNNLECELFRMLIDEAFEYMGDKNKIFEFPSNNEQEFERSVAQLLDQLYKLLEF